MNAKLIKTFATVAIFMLAITVAQAQSAYFNAVTNLNPAGYWPMHETEPAARGDIETNYGSLGLLGTGYYPDWAPQPSTTGFQHLAAPSPINKDSDSCLSFLYSVNTGSGFVDAWYTNDLYIPRISPLITLITNWTVECWIHNNNGVPQGTGFKGVDMWGEFGFDNLNSGGTASGLGDGVTLNWNGGWFASLVDQNNAGLTFGGDTIGPTNQWMYIYVTCDANTNVNVYYNGNEISLPSSGVGKLIPDYWTPFEIGGARGGTRSWAGWCADFAIYTNALGLGDAEKKYFDATNTASTTNGYYFDVTNDQPVVFYRMDSPPYTPPAPNTWPVLTNYGSAGGNGVYTPGTMPGVVSGPFSPTGVHYAGMVNNSALLSGISSFGDIGYAPAYNPTGSNANFTVSALFRGNPCDGRFESIVGRGTNSWQLGLSTNGCIVFNAGNATNVLAAAVLDPGCTGNSPGDMPTIGIYNDGNWHQVVAVNQTNVISIYVDGVLDTNGTPAGITTTNLIQGNLNDVMIGSDPSYTNNPVGVGRSFAGQICDVAFFTNALTAAQVQALYNSQGVIPYIETQPSASGAVSAGAAYTNTVTAGGNTPLYYQWYTNGVAVAGQTNASLLLNPVTTNNASTDYYLIITNNFGSATSSVASLTVYAAPTLFGEFPITYSNLLNTSYLLVYSNASPTFSISALGQSLAYYWYTNNVLDAAATGSSLTWPNANVSFSDYCIISNFLGTITSEVWSASVIADPTNPANGLAPYPQAVLALDPIGYWRLNEPDDQLGQGNEGDIAHDYAGGNDGIYTNVYLSLQGYNPPTDPSDTSVQVGTWNFNNCGVIGLGPNIDVGTPVGFNGEFSVECWVDFLATNKNGGVVSKGWSGGGEEFSIGSTNNGTNPGMIVRTANGTPYAASGTFTPLLNTWYHFCGVCDEANGLLSFYVNGVLVGSTAIPAHSGILSDTASSMLIGAQPSGLGNAQRGINDLQPWADINDVAVFNYALTSTQVLNQYSQAAFPPFIGQQPPALTYVARGTSPVVSASVSGTSPMTFRWFETNLVAQTGHLLTSNTVSGFLPASDTVTIANIITNDNYFLSANNADGSTNTTVATLIVYSNAFITAEFPITQTNIGNTNFMKLYAGANPKFSVSALGIGTITNQWYTNGVACGAAAPSSATVNTTLALSNVRSSFTVYCIMTSANTFSPGNTYSTTSAVWSASVTATPLSSGGGSALYPQQVMALNPVNYWRLNEADDNLNDGDPGIVAYDYASGNNGIYTNVLLGNTGTNQYNPIEDPSGTSVQVGAYASPNSMVEAVGTNVDFTSPSGTVTGLSVECWVKFNNISSFGLVTKGYIGSSEFDFQSSYNPPTMFPRFYLYTANGTAKNADAEPVTTNVWYHMVGVCDEVNNITSIYIDGGVQGSFGMAGQTGINSRSGYNLVIGAASSSAANAAAGIDDLQADADVSDVAIFNYALTPAQILNEYLLGGQVGPSFNPAPPTTATGGAGLTLNIPVTAQGTPVLGYTWTNLTTSAAIAAGTTNNSGTINASLSYPNVPLSWNGDELEVIVTNAYGTANAFVTLTITNTVSLNPTNILVMAANNQLTLSWPADHTGWQLQAQTNSLAKGISTNWVNVSGSTTTNRVIVPVNVANGSVFYRLLYIP